MCRAGTLVLWLWEKTRVPKVVGSNPGTIIWMDITFSHIFVVRIVKFVWKDKNKRKRPRLPIFLTIPSYLRYLFPVGNEDGNAVWQNRTRLTVDKSGRNEQGTTYLPTPTYVRNLNYWLGQVLTSLLNQLFIGRRVNYHLLPLLENF